MDIEDLYFKKYIGEFYSQNNMDELYKYVQTCTEELTISSSDLTDFIMQTIKGGTPDMKIKYGDNSINASYIFNEVSEKILENIPETIKKLSVPYLLFKNNYKTLEKFKNLEELEINDSFPLTEDEIIFLSENTNIKTIIISGTKNVPFDLNNYKKVLFALGNNQGFAIYKNIKMKFEQKSYQKNTMDIIGENFSMDMLDDVLKLFSEEYEKIRIVSNENSYTFTIKDNKVTISIYNPNMNVAKNLCDYFAAKKIEVENVNILLSNGKKNINYFDYDYSVLDNLSKKVNIQIRYDLTTTADYEDFRSLCECIKWYRKIITDYELSPVEKLTVAYDILKTFEYNETKSEDLLESRDPTKIVKTGHIVCAGYTSMLEEIFKDFEPNIKIGKFGVSCYGFDNKTLRGKHSRAYAVIDDPKYNIHGTYALDPTWDSVSKDGKDAFGDDYTALDLYRYYLVPFTEYNSVFKHDSVLPFFSEEREYLNEKKLDSGKIEELYNEASKMSEKDYKNIFGDEVIDTIKSDKEKLKYFCAPRIPTAVMMNIVSNARLAEGYTKEKIAQEMEKVQKIYEITNPELSDLTETTLST